MIHSANEMAEKLSFVIADTGEVMSQMANGNYNITSKNPDMYQGDFEQLFLSIRNMKTQMVQTLRSIEESSRQVSAGAATLADASDAASYVQELAGDDVNIIFGAMYDESKSDSCTITVIATGLEDRANNGVQNRLGGGAAFRQPASHMTPSSLKGMNIQSTAPTTSQGQGGQAPRPIQPVPGIHKPTDIRSSVEEKSLKIPDFLQKK